MTHATFGLEPLESRQLMAQISWDGGGGDSAWLNPLNWSGDTLPGPGDQVTIAAPGSPTIELAGGSVLIAGLRSSDTLRITGGSLAVAGDWAQSAPLELSGGAIAGGGDLRISSGMLWSGGGISGSGRLQILPGATLTIAGDVTLAQRRIVNNGSVVWASGTVSADGATIINLPGRTFLAQSPGSILAAGAPSIFSNYGLVLRDGAGDSTTTIAITLSNFGTSGAFIPTWGAPPGPWMPPPPPAPQPGAVEVRAGTLSLTGAVAQIDGAALLGGDWAVTSTSGRLLLPGGDLDLVAGRIALIGAGAAFPQIEHATKIYSLTLAGGRAYTFDRLASIPGTLSVSGSYSIPGVLDAAGLDVASGDLSLTGTNRLLKITLGQGASLTLAGDAMLSYADISGPGLLRLTGHASWASGRIAGPGQFIIAPGATLAISQGPIVVLGLGGADTTKRLTRRTVNYGRIDWTAGNDAFNLSGEFVNRGILDLDGGPYLSTNADPGQSARALIQNFGTLNTYRSLTLRGAGGGVGLLNSGTVNVFGGRLLLNGGGLTSGAWTINTGAELAFGGLAGSIQGASIGGPGLLRIATTLGWSATTAGGSGQFLISPAGRLIAAGGGSLISRDVINSGTLELAPAAALRLMAGLHSAGQLQLSTGRLDIGGLVVLDPTSVLGLSSTGPSTHGSLVFHGVISLGGRIAAAFSWPTPVPLGTHVDFMVFNPSWAVGAFSGVSATGLPEGAAIRLSYAGTVGTLVIISA